MKTNRTARSLQLPLAWLAVSRALGLLIAGLIGWLWVLAAEDPAWKAVAWKVVVLVVVVPLAVRIGIKWLRFCGRRRLRAMWDAYAEQELAKRTYLRRSVHARPQSQNR
jgi:membrane protein YdbS with pleckstrin-like domain